MRMPTKTPVVLAIGLGLVVVVALAVAAWVERGGGDPAVTAAAQSTPASAPPGLPTVSSGATPSASASSARPSASVSSSASSRPSKTPATAAVQAPSSFPQAATTGLRAGVRLKATSSTSLRIRKAGTVVDGADIRGEISVEANNVTIKNSRVINVGDWGIVQREGANGLVVEDSEIRGNGKDRMQYAILNLSGAITILRNNISAVSDAISTNVGRIEDNYLHDPVYFDGDHTDMIQSNSGPPAGQQLVIRHNTVINTLEQTSAVALFEDFGVQHDALIEGNLLAGGAYALYGGAGEKGTTYNIKVIGNVFSREVYPTGGQYGPVAHWDDGSGNVWQGNVWAGTNQIVTSG